jgi:UDP-N-acetylglucosamine 4-epimerase
MCLNNFLLVERQYTALLGHPNFTLIVIIRNLSDYTKAATGVDYILHQAALGSVHSLDQ